MITVRSDISVQLVQQVGGDFTIMCAAKVLTPELLEDQPDNPSQCKRMIDYLMRKRHGTPFEHGLMTFCVRAPIFIWREWHRHRIGFSYNEQSARYSELLPEFWHPRRERKMEPIPEPKHCTNRSCQPPNTLGESWALRKIEAGLKICDNCKTRYEYHASPRPCFRAVESDEAYAQLNESLKESYESSYITYQQLLQAGMAKEVARACLPVAIYSSCWVTCNPRSIMAFLSLRTHEPSAKFPSYPQAEIEEAARQVEEIFRQHYPITHAAFCEHGRVAP